MRIRRHSKCSAEGLPLGRGPTAAQHYYHPRQPSMSLQLRREWGEKSRRNIISSAFARVYTGQVGGKQTQQVQPVKGRAEAIK